MRRRAFAALRELFARLGDRRTLIIWIDDLQWGDTLDSAVLLAELLRPPDPPAFLLLAACRSEDASTSPVLRGLADLGDGDRTTVRWRVLAVDVLATQEAQSLVASLLERGDAASHARAASIARESGGNPFFVAELVRHIQARDAHRANFALDEEITLDRVLWARILRLPQGIRRLLEIIAVAGRPISSLEACQAAELEGDARGALSMLGLGTYRLIRSTGPTERDQVEPYHDRVRESVLSHLEPATLASRHRRLVQVLSASGGADPEVLATHYEAAGEPESAGEYYEMAAAQAAKALAFDRAVKLYRRALDLRQGGAREEYQLRLALGDALTNAGCGAEAAAQYLTAADAGSTNESLDLRCRAATQLLTSGNIDEGLGVLDGVLRSVGMRLPSSYLGALGSMLLRRLQVRVRGLHFLVRDQCEVEADDLRKLDIFWSVASGLGVVDFVRGFDFHSRHLLLALRTGETRRIAKSLAWEAAHTSVAGAFRRERTARILRTCERLYEHCNDNYIRAFIDMSTGCAAYLEGRWATAHASLGSAETLFTNSCTGVTWELDTTRTFSLWSLIYMGSLTELSQRLTVLLRVAEARGDLFFLMNLSTYITSIVMVGNDEPGAARDALTRVSRRWSQRGFHVQHHNVLLATVVLDLYEGDGRAAWNYISERWPAYRRSLLLHVQQVRFDVNQLWARSALAVAAKSADLNPFLTAAERSARGLERERVPWATAHARSIQAGIAAIRGHRSKAVALLEEAARCYEAADMRLFAAVARRRLGELVGGIEGQSQVAAADAWMACQGIRKPGRIAAMYMPGFPDQE